MNSDQYRKAILRNYQLKQSLEFVSSKKLRQEGSEDEEENDRGISIARLLENLLIGIIEILLYHVLYDINNCLNTRRYERRCTKGRTWV